MVTALITDADKPATNAKLHRNIITTIVFKIFPFLKISRGLNSQFKMSKIIPTCKPETAKI